MSYELGQDVGVPDQQYDIAIVNHRRAVQAAMASRIVFQMDHKRFIGNRENAVKTQIWCANATYVLIAIVKKEHQIDATLYTLLQILSFSVFEKTQLSQAFAEADYISEYDHMHNQLNLFDF